MPNNKVILITGATGYLGGYLSKAFLDRNHTIIALALNKNELFKWKEYPNSKTYYLDETTLEEIFSKNKIDMVIQTATLYGRNDEQLSEMVCANIEFPLKVLSCAIKNNVKTFINTNTILAKNLNPYSITKSQFAEWLEMYSDKIQAINMKLDHFYGPNEKSIKFVAWLIEQFKNNVDKIDLTEGSQTRDFVYIEDVVSAFMCIVDNLDKIPVGKLNNFEVGTGNKTSIKELVLTLKELMGNKTTKLNFGAIPYRKNEVLTYDVDISNLKLLGWSAAYDINRGLLKLLNEEKL